MESGAGGFGKCRISLLFVVILLIQPPASRSSENPHLVYRSPAPGAGLTSPATNLIMRFDQPVASASLPQARLRVIGSSSGPVEGTLTLSDDGRTILYQPVKDFVRGENVHVTLSGGIMSTGGMDFGPLDWHFTVSADAQPQLDPLASISSELASGVGPQPSGPHSIVRKGMGDLPIDFPSIRIAIDSVTPPGGIFLSNITFVKTIVNTPYLMILKESGDPYFYKELPTIGFDFKRQEGGQYTYFLTDDIGFVSLDSMFQRIGAYKAGNGYTTDLHELRLLPDGHALLLASDPETVDMSALVPGGSPRAVVTGMILQELDQSGNVVFQWRSWDHFNITDATLTDFTASEIDPVHSNAIEVDADGNYLLSSRHLDEITKINRTTGEIMWRLGGKNNQFRLLGDTLWFSHQHAIRILPNGHYILFDNGNGHTPQFSRAIEFVLDTVSMTCRFVWQYARPGTYSQAMGYVQRLQDGNTFIGWGATGPAVSIVTPEGKVVYELWLPDGVFSYRASVSPWLPPPGFANRGNSVPQKFSLHPSYPNPFNPTTTIEYETPYPAHVTLKVYNALGEEVAQLADRVVDEGLHYALFNGLGMPSGVYFCQLRAGSFVQTQKLLLEK